VSSGAGDDRIGGLDLARGLAVLGMFGAHLRIGDELTTDPSTWAAVVDGRSSILFATLAGVSMALLSGRTRPADGVELVRARLRIAVRAAWVFAIGAVLEWLDTFVAIILGVYAVLFVLALPFLRWPPRRLLAAAGVVAVAGPPLDAVLGQVLSVADAEEHYVAELLVTGTYPAMLWIAFVLVGLAIGRLDLSSTRVATRLLVGGLALATGRSVQVSRRVLPVVVLAGVGDMTANALFLVATQVGEQLAITGVLASLYPVSTVVLAQVVLRERLAGAQRAGLAVAAAAVVLIALPG
jgi:uncharacterized membrane protein